jgi:hypothetical protein
VENLAESTEAECPVCLGRMEPEDRSGVAWLACPNGCPTEFEAPAPKPTEETLEKSAAA